MLLYYKWEFPKQATNKRELKPLIFLSELLTRDSRHFYTGVSLRGYEIVLFILDAYKWPLME